MNNLLRSAGSCIGGMGVGPAIGAFASTRVGAIFGTAIGLASARGICGSSANDEESGFAGAGGIGVAGFVGKAVTDGFGADGRAGVVVTGALEIGGGEATGLAGTLFSGAGSISVKISPDFVSFTSVSTLPSDLRTDFTTLTVFSP